MKKLSFFANLGLGQEKEYFVEQLSMLLSAGMPVITALSAIKKEIKSGRLKKIIEEVSVGIEAGSSISTALDSGGIFPQSTISLIRIGEKSGRLAENLKVVAKQQQKDKEFRSKTASAMMYPLFVFSLTIIVGLGIAWFILPRLATVFAQLKRPAGHHPLSDKLRYFPGSIRHHCYSCSTTYWPVKSVFSVYFF